MRRLRHLALALLLLPGFALPADAAELLLCEGELAAGTTAQRLAGMRAGDRQRTLLLADVPFAHDCPRVSLPVDAGAVRWARLLNEASLAPLPASIILQGRFDERDVAVSELILPSPDRDAGAPVEDAGFAPVAPPAPVATAGEVAYAAWYWRPALWREQADALLAHANAAGIDRLYLTFDVREDGSLHDEDMVAEFIAHAHAAEMQVWAVYGDRDDLRPENERAVLRRADAVLRYNRTHPAQPIDGLQLDIEPYLMSGFDLAEAYWQTRYRDVINAVGATLGGDLPLNLVVPVWWRNEPLWGQALLSTLEVERLSLTVMNYRTDIDRLARGARPFLAWGTRHGVRVYMALETGFLPDEARKHFYPASAGRLWILELDSQPVIVLFDSPVENLPGSGYRLAFESQFDADNLSFHAQDTLLEQTLSRLIADWSAWPAFAGIALHGLDERLVGDLER